MDALAFLKSIETDAVDLVLYDPPYSITQAAQLYTSYGKEKLEINVSNMAYWARCKDEIARIVKPGGGVLCCGWNSNGIGKGRGFKMEKLLIVAHGGSKNDTIVTVERKMGERDA
jgi:DNA modification methylase